MHVLEIIFLAGRYHATPWGRNVNEGAVEWPPAPYRLARALADLCYRRHSDWAEDRLADVLNLLSSPPRYSLPSATAAHTRSFLNSNKKDPTDKQKIFDAFVVVSREARLYIELRGASNSHAVKDLQTLVGELGYLGRSESWVQARLLDSPGNIEFNCEPLEQLEQQADPTTGERVTVACLRPESEYKTAPATEPKKRGKGKKNAQKKADEDTLSWVRAICLSTGELNADGWSIPPAQKLVDYLRPADALDTRPPSPRRILGARFHQARFALHSKVLPRVTETVSFAERIRAKLMGISRRRHGGDPAAVSPVFSGKDAAGRPAAGHKHAYFLPLDEDGDGRLDHLIVCATQPFDSGELAALDRLRSVWQSNGRPDVRLVLVALSADQRKTASRYWTSATPFVTGRHHRRGRGPYNDWLRDEIIRECSYHGLPNPVAVHWTSNPPSRGRVVRWFDFQRSRKGRQPHSGVGCTLEFDRDVMGPFALGSCAHFGLGLFVSAQKERSDGQS